MSASNVKYLTLLSSAARTTTGASTASAAATAVAGTSVDATPMLHRYAKALVLLNVTAASAAGTDTLDVYLQKNVGPEGGTAVWTDFVHFSQVLGNGGAVQYYAALNAQDLNGAMRVVQNKALAVGAVSGPWGKDWQVAWTIAGSGSFTFAVTAQLFELA